VGISRLPSEHHAASNVAVPALWLAKNFPGRFRAQKLLSSGVVEGPNTSLNSPRQNYGFPTFRGLEVVLYQSLGMLPEPESTREFS
jgi:hypothetical protein